MSYHFTTTLDQPFDEAVATVTEALKAKGFGIMTTIDVKKALKQKIDIDFRPYVILGACNPKYAHAAIGMEDKIGTMLPCNVVVQDKGTRVEVSAIDPLASMQAVHNGELRGVATEVQGMLRDVIEGLGK